MTYSTFKKLLTSSSSPTIFKFTALQFCVFCVKISQKKSISVNRDGSKQCVTTCTHFFFFLSFFLFLKIYFLLCCESTDHTLRSSALQQPREGVKDQLTYNCFHLTLSTIHHLIIPSDGALERGREAEQGKASPTEAQEPNHPGKDTSHGVRRCAPGFPRLSSSPRGRLPHSRSSPLVLSWLPPWPPLNFTPGGKAKCPLGC